MGAAQEPGHLRRIFAGNGELSAMKMFFLVYDVEFDEEVIEGLAEQGIKGYTKWQRVLGKGVRSEPKMDDAVWPGHNCALALSVPSEQEHAVREGFLSLCRKMGGKGLRIFSWPVEEVL